MDALLTAAVPIAASASPTMTSARGFRLSSGMIPHWTSSAALAPVIRTRPIDCWPTPGASASRSSTRNAIACPVIACAWPITSPTTIHGQMRASVNGNVSDEGGDVATVTLAPVRFPPIDG